MVHHQCVGGQVGLVLGLNQFHFPFAKVNKGIAPAAGDNAPRGQGAASGVFTTEALGVPGHGGVQVADQITYVLDLVKHPFSREGFRSSLSTGAGLIFK